MHPLINTHRQEIAELARRYGVRRLEVFGSILRDDFDESSSDIDVILPSDTQSGGSSCCAIDSRRTRAITLSPMRKRRKRTAITYRKGLARQASQIPPFVVK